MFTQFCQGLFTSSQPLQIDLCLFALNHVVTNQMDTLLCQPFTVKEVKSVVFQMAPYKTPRPDGFGAYFYQYHWSTLGFKITEAVLSFLNGSSSITYINYTYLALISKKQ